MGTVFVRNVINSTPPPEHSFSRNSKRFKSETRNFELSFVTIITNLFAGGTKGVTLEARALVYIEVESADGEKISEFSYDHWKRDRYHQQTKC